jgi:hypothetical protein
MLAFCSASAVGSTTTVFVLVFSTVWAAGNLGYSLAVHRLRKGTETAVPSCPTKGRTEDRNFNPYVGAPFVVLWTLVTTLIVNLESLTDELEILMMISYLGWIHVAVWLSFVALVPMDGFNLGEQITWLAPALLLWMVFSPVLCIVSMSLSVLCHFLLLMALVAFLWYNLAIFKHYLETATPRYMPYFRAKVTSTYFRNYSFSMKCSFD